MYKNSHTDGEGRNPLFYLFSKTWLYSEGNRKSIVAYWILFITGNTAYFTIQPLLLKRIIDIIQLEGINQENISTLLGYLVGNISLNYFFWLCHGPARLLERANAFKSRSTYRKGLFWGIMGMPLGWHSENHSGDTIDKIEKGTQGLYSFASDSFQAIFAFVRLTVSFSMLIYFSDTAKTRMTTATIVVTMIVITVLVIRCFDKIILEKYKTLNKAENKISEHVFDTISNITTVVVLRTEKYEYDTFEQKTDEPFELYKETNKLNETKWFMVEVCSTFMYASVLGCYFWQNMGTPKGILVGTVFLMMRYLNELTDLFFRFADMYGEILQRYSRVLNSELISKDFSEKETSNNHLLPIDWKEVKVNNLNFAYQLSDGNTMHLEDVAFSFKKGEKVLFVGKKGSGKTTALKMIRNLYEPKTSNVFVDGKFLKEGLGGINNSVALIPQKPDIFAKTIYSNITMGKQFSKDVVDRFVNLSCFTDIVNKLPKGLESSIREKGVNLSGGQSQILALTRGLLLSKGCSILLLDEPTSSVDMTTESKIYKNIFEEFKDSAIIVSTHQRRLFPLFDYIYVFKEGKIVGAGSMDTLIKNCPEFRDLMEHEEEIS